MSVFTKTVVAHWLNWANDDYREKRDEELMRLISEGKTDGIMHVDGYTVYRVFLDQESALYWEDWLTLNAPAGLLLGTEIIDTPLAE